MTRDALVVGGGLAGAAFATRLAQAGRDVVVIEREAGPHDKVCGEFLSHEALGYLDRLDVSPWRLGAVPIDRVLLSRGAHASERKLPFPAASLSRRVLDEALLARAEAAGACVSRGSGVQHLTRSGGGWTARLSNGESVEARRAALACGKHDVRDHVRPPGLQNDLIGLKTHLRLTPGGAASLRGAVAIGLYPGGYAGLEPVEGGLANLCLVVRRATFARLGRDWDALLAFVGAAAPALGALLDGASPTHPRPLAIARIPYGHVARPDGGPWRLGDQAVVIPSFSGDGMSIALHSASLAASILLNGGSSAAYQSALARDVGLRVRLATRLSQAIVLGGVQETAALAARAFPQALSLLAAATRIPRHALPA